MARFLGEKCATTQMTRQERFQRHKERMDRLIFFMMNGKPSPDTDKKELRNLRNQAKHHVWDTYKQELYYVGKGNVRKKVVTDIDETVALLQQYHTAQMGGHSGINSTLAKISLHYTWNMMKEDIVEYISNCDRCQFHSKLKPRAPELKCIKVEEALELVSMDFIGPLPTTEKCYRYVLTFTDYYTKFVDLYPQKDKTAAGVANCIRTFVCRWGAPRSLLSDQGPEFVAEINTEACRSFNITTSVTSAYQPQTNGLDERTNQTLKMRLSKLVSEHPTDWDSFLEDVAYALRTQNQATTKHSPFFLMFGRHPRPTREMGSGDDLDEGLPTAPEVKLDESVVRRQEVIAVVKQHLGELGKGAVLGGGGVGSIREAGGALGKRQAAGEELYFRHKEQELLAALRVHHQEEIDHHKKEIERLQREIDRHKGKIRKLHI